MTRDQEQTDASMERCRDASRILGVARIAIVAIAISATAAILCHSTTKAARIAAATAAQARDCGGLK